MKKRVLLFLIILYSGCLQELPYNTTIVEQNLVVDALLCNLNENQVVKLSRTLAYGVPPQAVTDAKITLIENDLPQNIFKETLTGQYELDAADYDPKVGSTYSLKIELSDGNKYASTPETLLMPIKPDSLVWKSGQKSVITRDGLIRNSKAAFISLYTPLDNGQENLFLKWDWKSNF